MAPEVLEASTQPDSPPPVKAWLIERAVREPSPAAQSQQGEDEGRAGPGAFGELEKQQPVGFFVFGVVQGGMAHGLSTIVSHCAIARFGSP
jgi:hypothetical protein